MSLLPEKIGYAVLLPNNVLNIHDNNTHIFCSLATTRKEGLQELAEFDNIYPDTIIPCVVWKAHVLDNEHYTPEYVMRSGRFLCIKAEQCKLPIVVWCIEERETIRLMRKLKE